MSQAKPIRIQRSRKEKQVSPNGLPIVYVGRPGKWGNPFVLGQMGLVPFGDNRSEEYQREVILRKFQAYLNEKPDFVQEIKKELKGKNLSCWCSLDKKCHADLLLKIANS